MQRLTAMTLGALCIGLAGFAYDNAHAQAPRAAASCPVHEVSVYFEKGESEFNQFSKALVEKVAQEAKACGAKQVVAEMGSGGQRATAVSNLMQAYGLKVVLVGPPRVAPQGDSIMDRMATLRVAPATTRVG